MIFAFASWSLLSSLLDRFWFHFGPPNRTKIDPKRALKSIPKMLTKMVAFGTDLGSILVRFWTPTWGAKGVQRIRFSGSSRLQEPHRSPNGPKTPSKIEFWWFGVAFGSIFDRFSATRLVNLTVNSQSNRRCATLPLHRMKTHENVKMNNPPTVLLVF